MSLSYNIVQIFLFFISGVYLLDIEITRDEDGAFSPMASDTAGPLQKQDVRLVFKVDNFKMSGDGHNIYDIYNNLSFYSEKGTVFDFQGKDQSTLHFPIKTVVTGKKIRFDNITFYNYSGISFESHLIYLGVYDDDTNKFTIEFNNCTFTKIDGIIFYTKLKCTKAIQNTPNVIFNNCKFMYV